MLLDIQITRVFQGSGNWLMFECVYDKYEFRLPFQADRLTPELEQAVKLLGIRSSEEK